MVAGIEVRYRPVRKIENEQGRVPNEESNEWGGQHSWAPPKREVLDIRNMFLGNCSRSVLPREHAHFLNR